ncbi:unnamed protein product [Rotaria sordida]|uniref:Uncharacterized protein n=1 Tax=Rotaria sordida TaxID=392033 RepID=A0A820CVM7_9BILA|nr:unnamed protein product [Rotaria sordida]CAF1545894.1 unnamed protein product [Rotaria sordida]CAF4136455.1 unnamed protein product [Rotaria sordida]CAF4214406.1 unnamed protein product [Rotaria sordida]
MIFNFMVHISTKLIKRSDNASVLAGQYTVRCEKLLSDIIGIKLIMRDYSEIQCGKSICDRLSGSAKLRKRAFINAGNDVMTGADIKKSFEYGGGIKNLKVGVAEVIGMAPVVHMTPIPELSSVPNILYDDTNLILRKAVQNQIKMLSNATKPQLVQPMKHTHKNVLNGPNPATQSKPNNYTQPLLTNDEPDNITLDEEDERAVKKAIQLENLKKTIIDYHS